MEEVGIAVIGIAVVRIVRVIVVRIIKVREGVIRVCRIVLLDLRPLDQMASLQHHEHSDGDSNPEP